MTIPGQPSIPHHPLLILESGLRFPRRRFAALLAAALLNAALGFGLVSCGTNAITDGGVPVGGTRAEQSGQAVEASNPSQPVSGAVVTLTAADGSTASTTTDSAGIYDFPSVPLGPATLRIEPSSGSDLQPQTLSIDVSIDSRQSVVAALPPRSVPLRITSIILAPTSLRLHPGDRVAITAAVLGQNLPVGTLPSLVVLGGVGHILPTGEFQATRAGSGSLVATLGGQSASIPITVLSGHP